MLPVLHPLQHELLQHTSCHLKHKNSISCFIHGHNQTYPIYAFSFQQIVLLTWYEGDVELPEPLFEERSRHMGVTAGAWLPLIIATLDTHHLVKVSWNPENALSAQTVHG